MKSIYIIGPKGVGKSTLAINLSQQLNLPRCCVDEVQWQYLAEMGFDQAKARALNRADLEGFLAYSASFMVSVIERAMTAHPNHIIDFGAGHTAIDEPNLVGRLKGSMSEGHTILLLPSADLGACEKLLPGPRQGMKLNPHFIRHPLQRELADVTIYTAGRTSTQVSNEALEVLANL